MKKILLTGASGYIGGNLLKKIKENHKIVAASRSTKNKENEENVEWKQVDLFAIKDVEEAMEGVDTAIYLVHSMQPAAKLTQASFVDMDAILADNFGRAAKSKGVKHIIFMSGIMPHEDAQDLSDHLRSRLECEKILGSYGVPVSTLRAGLIIGPKGSSFPVLKKLTERLPALVLPKWAYSKTAPVALKDVIEGLAKLIERNPEENESIDIYHDVTDYKGMFKETAKVMNKKLPMVDLPIIPVSITKPVVSLLTGEPKELVYPLLDSLVHDMVPSKENYVEGITNAPTPLEESIKIALDEDKDSKKKDKKKETIGEALKKSDVKSVQRITIPQSWSIDQTANYYMNWLSRIGMSFINTAIEGDTLSISLPIFKDPILILQKNKDYTDEDRVLFMIKGGKFSKKVKDGEEGRARLEFRRILDTNECIIAIHEYEPTLPWAIYKLTQARVHLIVMTLFGYETKILEKTLDSTYLMDKGQQSTTV
ncbi:NAD-dependent epimerase/dehydratase family protein [Macrococcus hajekii]|uniref:NAD-dependent epimerase/dehydratase family protein n=1 Tax=Macrococcus hajekii TaxID=198482 RepID=A0A4R6BJ10_9STAP|nr:NAD(P)H-binding protein [Macrococcus hajekii]TDM01588.1 NAD-dependent epimerase/dehydratase family protein [Macrococcus hajekii]GGB01252.1 NmrA family protein [Macrococcus hajekii]